MSTILGVSIEVNSIDIGTLLSTVLSENIEVNFLYKGTAIVKCDRCMYIDKRENGHFVTIQFILYVSKMV